MLIIHKLYIIKDACHGNASVKAVSNYTVILIDIKLICYRYLHLNYKYIT